MIYPKNFEQKTGFDKIRQLVSEKCISSLGKERVEAMAFSSEYDIVQLNLKQTDEFLQIMAGNREFPASYFFDVRTSLKRIRPDGTWLDEQELFDLRRSLQTISDILRFLHPENDEEILYPSLNALTEHIISFPNIISKIEIILDKNGHIRDNASPKLADMRREKYSTMSSISRSLMNILRSAQNDGLVDKDAAPAIRDGRLMIPVAPSFKRKIKGIVHDESASGKTVFIEPEVVVEANNRIRELESDERREIMRILTDFTSLIRPLAPDMLESYEFLAEIDFIRAKAIFARDINATYPKVSDTQEMDWIHAIHPLLFLSLRKQQKEVVPLDISLDKDKRILIISGPNAGGKSVCLETVGLLQYMLQCGMLVPLYNTSHVGIFHDLFIDIGDEQSIENDLSTYSSHLTNMKNILKNCNEKTLLLIDEFGSGTEPQIGGAIAKALLARFNNKHAFGVITTHYQNLKHFAEETKGIVNGAMLYDRQQMQPLFRLSIGNPGSSFAIEIARKIGLPDDVISEASAEVGSDYVNMDKYLQDIVRDKRYWENKRQTIHQQEKKLSEITQSYEANLQEMDFQRKEIIRAAKDEAKNILSGANAMIENTIREIKESQAEKEQTKLARRALEEFKNQILSKAEENEKIAHQMARLQERKERKENKRKNKNQNKEAVEKKTFSEKPIAIGDVVRLKGQTAVGKVMELSGKQATVAFGMIKSTVKTEQLEKANPTLLKKPDAKSTFVSEQTADEMHEKKLNFKQEIDVRGMRGDEALQTVTYFIDDAIQVGASRIRILHGTGTGILRQLIREYLASVDGIKSFHDEHVQLGGAGITVVELE